MEDLLLIMSIFEEVLAGFIEWILIALASVIAAMLESARRLREKVRRQDDRIDDIEGHLDLSSDPTRLERHEQQIGELRDTQNDFRRWFEGDEAAAGVLEILSDLKAGQEGIQDSVDDISDWRNRVTDDNLNDDDE